MASLLANHAVPTRSLDATLGVYVHVPFCQAKCHYCDFATAVGAENRVESYLDALAQEISARGGGPISTLFIGGGTPTTLSPAQINRMFSSLRSSFDFSGLTEATVEANPESSTDDILRAYRDNGINRLSFGLQTSQPALLKALGRLHDFEGFVEAYHHARSLGFSSINIDLMYGLPGQTLEDWNETLRLVTDLHPEHISAYALKVEPRTHFGNEKLHPDDDLEADMYLVASDFLIKHGYRHYEISNFAKPDHESRHNLRYWLNQSTIGLGISAASFNHHVRSKNTSVLSDYIRDWTEKKGSVQREEVSLVETEREKESVMLQLRLDKGVSTEIVRHLNLPVFNQFLDHGLARIENERYRLTPQGWLLSNQLFQHLVS